MISNKCCYKCSDRQVGCHAECEKYKEYRDQLEADKETRIANARKNDLIMDYYGDCKEQRRKRGNK